MDRGPKNRSDIELRSVWDRDPRHSREHDSRHLRNRDPRHLRDRERHNQRYREQGDLGYHEARSIHNFEPKQLQGITVPSSSFQNDSLSVDRGRKRRGNESPTRVLKGSKESQDSGFNIVSREDPKFPVQQTSETRAHSEYRDSQESDKTDKSAFCIINDVDQQIRTGDSEPKREADSDQGIRGKSGDRIRKNNHIINGPRAENTALEERVHAQENKNLKLQQELLKSRLRIHSLQKQLQHKELEPLQQTHRNMETNTFIEQFKKLLKRRYTRHIIAVTILLLVVGLAFLIIWLLLKKDIDDQHTKQSVRLGDEIKLNFTVTDFVEKNYDEMNLTTPSDITYTFPKHTRKKRSNDPWKLLTAKSSSRDTSFTFSSPSSDCSFRGEYLIIFIKDSKEIHRQKIFLDIKGQHETSGSINRIDDNEKEFRCSASTACERSFVTVRKNDVSRSDLMDKKINCESTFDPTTGYQHTCFGKTTKSAIVCFLETENVDRTYPKENLVSECDDKPCNNSGTCTVPEGGKDFVCACKNGFTGRQCQTNVDDCKSNPCLHGAICTDGVNRYDCTCTEGYTGTNCEIDIDECKYDVCKNGASCSNQMGSYKCTCEQGYNGKKCKTDIDECQLDVCENEASCVNQDGSYVCNCLQGYSGKNCEKNIDDCSPNPCQNDANCIDLINGYKCTCVPGYTGPNCDRNIDDCDPDPCFHGSSCTDKINGYECNCGKGYTGTNCQLAQPNMPCEDDDDCISGATCMENNCNCQAPYIISNDKTSCVFGCRESCTDPTKDFYAIYQNPCGNKFIRCFPGDEVTQECNPGEVFNPTEEACTCIPKEFAGWCNEGASGEDIIDVCGKTCSNYKLNSTPKP